MTNMIEAEGLAKRFGQTQALRSAERAGRVRGRGGFRCGKSGGTADVQGSCRRDGPRAGINAHAAGFTRYG